MTLFEDERVLYRAEPDLLVTTHRVRDGSDSEFTSMMLEEVCSIRAVRMAHRWLLIFAAVFAVLAGYFAILSERSGSIESIESSTRAAGILTVIAVGLVVAYRLTRFSAVEVASAGARILFNMRSVKNAEEFVNSLESAKNERYMLMTAIRSESPSG